MLQTNTQGNLQDSASSLLNSNFEEPPLLTRCEARTASNHPSSHSCYHPSKLKEQVPENQNHHQHQLISVSHRTDSLSTGSWVSLQNQNQNPNLQQNIYGINFFLQDPKRNTAYFTTSYNIWTRG